MRVIYRLVKLVAFRIERESKMLKKFVERFRMNRVWRPTRGSVMPIFAVMSLPVLLSAGVGVDMTRLSMARTTLQSAVNGAALAGATTGATQSPSTANGVATTVATNYFNGVTNVPGGASNVAVSSLVVTPQTVNGSSYQVSVVATGSMKTVFMGLGNLLPGVSGLDKMPLSVHATANNTSVPGSQAAGVQPILNKGYIGSSAWDWNQAYLYPVPYFPYTTTPDYAKLPDVSQFYKIGDNCASSSSQYRAGAASNGGSLCNGDGVHPSNCSLQGTATSVPFFDPGQPLAIFTMNMTSGLWTNGGASPDNRNYNQAYGAVPGSCQVMSSAYLGLGQPPSQNIDNSAITLNELNIAAILSGTISLYISPYQGLTNPLSHLALPSWDASVNALPLNDCALILQAVDPSNLPLAPPGVNNSNTQCFSSIASSNTASGDPASGRQLANLSCNQMAGRTIEYWFNDMGGGNISGTLPPVDPRDYNNLEFSIRCTGTTATPGRVNGPASSTVSLLH